MLLVQCAGYAIKNDGILKMVMGKECATMSIGDQNILDIPIKWYPKIINICKLSLSKLPHYSESIVVGVIGFQIEEKLYYLVVEIDDKNGYFKLVNKH